MRPNQTNRIAATITALTSSLTQIPFALSFVAITATAWFGGFYAGILSTLISALAINYFVFSPRFTFSLSKTASFQTGLLVAVSLFICAIARQRERDEDQLEQVENSFEITLQSIGDAVVATDSDGRVTFLNTCAEKLTGWSSADARNRSLSEVLKLSNQLTGEVTENPVTRVIQTGRIMELANHTILTSRSGQRFPIEDSAAPIRNIAGELKGVVLVFRDVSAKHVAEERRNESQRVIRDLVESIDEGFESLDRNWNFTYINQQGAKINGHKIEELIGKNHWEIFPEALGTKFESAMRMASENRIPATVTDFYPPFEKWIQISAYPAPDGISVLFQDVTQNVEAQERMRVADRLATAGRLAAAVSHEINNPLEAVSNLIYLAKDTTSEREVIELLAEAERQLFRVAHIAKQTLTFYKHSEEVAEVPVSSAIEDAVKLFKSRMESRGVRLAADMRETPTVRISPGELVQVVANLLGNALDVAPSGSEVRIRVLKTDGMAVIEVADVGPGIPAHLKERIFEPFFTTKKDIGTGLGLWVVKNIVEKHGGTISAQNRTDIGGAIFKVELPAVTPPSFEA
jgi:PAS domain S-box-containing protein